MEITLDKAVNLAIIITMSAGAVKYIVIDPLQNAINNLRASIVELKDILSGIQKEQVSLRERIIIIEQHCKSCQEDIDK